MCVKELWRHGALLWSHSGLPAQVVRGRQKKQGWLGSGVPTMTASESASRQPASPPPTMSSHPRKHLGRRCGRMETKPRGRRIVWVLHTAFTPPVLPASLATSTPSLTTRALQKSHRVVYARRADSLVKLTVRGVLCPFPLTRLSLPSTSHCVDDRAALAAG